jgi:hypothetical protein
MAKTSCDAAHVHNGSYIFAEGNTASHATYQELE